MTGRIERTWRGGKRDRTSRDMRAVGMLDALLGDRHGSIAIS